MMKGNNELTLNELTMIEAVQMWIDAQMREGKAPTVTGIKFKEDYNAKTFIVALSDAANCPPKLEAA